MSNVKIKHTKVMRIINANAVQGRLSEHLSHEIFLTRNIRDLWYYSITVTVIYSFYICQQSGGGGGGGGEGTVAPLSSPVIYMYTLVQENQSFPLFVRGAFLSACG